MEKKSTILAKDIPLSRLVPTNPKKFTKPELAKVRTSMEAIGMMEPLCVFENGEEALISDGNKRYFILLEAGIRSAPCVLLKLPDTYTASYQVIGLSPTERIKMIKKVQEKVSDDKIAAAIGVPSLTPGIDKNLADKLNPAIILAFNQGLLSKTALRELKNVTLKRQAEILKELKQAKNYSLDVIKGLVLATPPTEQVPITLMSPWKKSEEKRNSITKQFQEAQKQSELMSHLFHTYVTDVSNLLIYIRTFLKDQKVEQYIMAKYPQMLKTFHAIMERE